ncbi:MAG: hypothetical protein KDK41_12770 [Leptospiraceae bacterium]|nr:hypothetical protein [Leptospiraceae bacterium]MCB1201513.1 hypothetical protein [Leptospiraceae bacterium]
MKALNFAYRELVIRGIITSFIFNIILFTGYIIALDYVKGNTVIFTIIILLVYLLVIQPIKDMLFAAFSGSETDNTGGDLSKVEKRAATIARKEEIPDFLFWLCKTWKMPWMRMTLYVNEPIVYLVFAKGGVRIAKLKVEEDKEFIAFLKAFPWTHKTVEMPPLLRNYLTEKRVAAVTPIIFRESVIGAIGSSRELNSGEIDSAEFVARRVAVLIENDQMKGSVTRNELLKKEFLLADRVEEFLMRDKPVIAGGYSVSRLSSAWEKKYFSALFEISVAADESRPSFVLLCRLANASIRANALQLFGVQGYFTAIARQASSVQELAQNLNLALLKHENGKVQLDGFLIEINSDTGIQVLGFGSNLGIKSDFKWTWIKNKDSLGNQDWETGLAEKIGNPETMVFTIRDFPLVYLTRK